jgi:putative transposase
MKHRPQQHHRRSIRLNSYDYSSPGAYFITICAHRKRCVFGEIVDGRMHRNDCGDIVQEEWFRSATIRKEIQFDAWVVMPNHVHGIVMITPPVGAHGQMPAFAIAPPKTGPHDHAPLQGRLPRRRPRSLGTFVGGFKSAVRSRINKMRGTIGLPVWQSNYYEHVIRNEDDLNQIREYILTNPMRWADDRENPECGVGAQDAGAHRHAQEPDWHLP